MDSISIQEIETTAFSDQVWPGTREARGEDDLKIPGLSDWVDDGKEEQPWEMGWGTEK